MNFKLPHDVVSACAKRFSERRADGGQPEHRSLMDHGLGLMNVSLLPRSGFIPPSRRQPLEFLCDWIS
ncbi:MAG: hypothetical protein K6G44_09115 [Lentisphaeria bacterium]|nr:hypothetical protein [Lentisphaeria bacterium]